MTWKTFIDAIHLSLITNDIPSKIIINFFNAGKCRKEFSESAASSWYYGNRNCNATIAIQEIIKEYQRQKTNQRSRKGGSARKPQQYHAEAEVII